VKKTEESLESDKIREETTEQYKITTPYEEAAPVRHGESESSAEAWILPGGNPPGTAKAKAPPKRGARNEEETPTDRGSGRAGEKFGWKTVDDRR
jgi:hypothetical protein